jgi:hypothetical protein
MFTLEGARPMNLQKRRSSSKLEQVECWNEGNARLCPSIRVSMPKNKSGTREERVTVGVIEKEGSL